MTTWIKFSERQPEKEGQYLCYHPDNEMDEIYLMDWHPPYQGFRGEGMRSGYFSDRYSTDNSYGETKPDYWAEITPPVNPHLCKVSGCGPVCRDPETIKALKKLIQKESPMPEKPLCKDCKWIDCSEPKSICSHQKSPRSLVSGNPNQSCENMRSSGESVVVTVGLAVEAISEICGHEGRWFEAKEEEKIMCEAKGGVEVVFKGADKSKVASVQEKLALATKIMALMESAGVKGADAGDVVMVILQLLFSGYDVSLKLNSHYR